jgi:hypothetical protein
LDGRATVLSLGDYFHGGLFFTQGPEALLHDGVIIRQKNPYTHGTFSFPSTILRAAMPGVGYLLLVL